MFRIKSIYLKNFIPLKASQGKDEIKIEFKDHSTVVLIGDNGSGKTALITELTPMQNEVVGGRTIPTKYDMEKGGIKEIVIENTAQKTEYVCRFEYNTIKNACYIKKNGEELNPNGNVNTYKHILKEEMGIDSDYSTSGYLSRDLTDILDMAPSERAKYIMKFIPNDVMAEYMSRHKKVTTIHNQLNKNIKEMAARLAKIDDIAALESSLSLSEARIKELTAQIESKRSAIDTVQGTLNGLDIPDNATIKKYIRLVQENKNIIEEKYNRTP
jgi:predicted ATP-binding protein involved in virulence